MADKKELPLALLEILRQDTDENHILSTKELTALLEKRYDLTLERRTLYANIELLKKYGFKISTWQENGFGYYMEEHQFDKSEVLLLCNAIHSSHFISASESKHLIDKLLSTLSREQQKEYKDQVFLPNNRKTNNETLMKTIYTVSSAIHNRKAIRFTYLKYDQNKKLVPRREEPYEVEPRYIVYQDSRPYLISTSDHHTGFAPYRLDRITKIELTDKKIPPMPKDIDAYEYTKNLYFMFNDEKVSAVLRCEKRILDHVIDVFGTDSRIIDHDSDHFDILIHGSETGIILFAQQYLDAAEITEPEFLRAEMRARIKKASKQYRQ